MLKLHALAVVLVVCVAAGGDLSSESKPAVRLQAYVPSGTVLAGGADHAPVPIVLEVDNHSGQELVVWDHPRVRRGFQSTLRRQLPELPATTQASQLRPLITLIYPDNIQLGGISVSSQIRAEAHTCPVGQSTLIKMEIPRQFFQPGADCDLVLTLRDGAITYAAPVVTLKIVRSE